MFVYIKVKALHDHCKESLVHSRKIACAISTCKCSSCNFFLDICVTFLQNIFLHFKCVRNNMKLRISEQFEATFEFPESYSLNSNASADIRGITTNWV